MNDKSVLARDGSHFSAHWHRRWLEIGAAFFLATTSLVANATTVVDPANDFLPTYTGERSPDLDFVSLSATFDGLSFHIVATMNGTITQGGGEYGTRLYEIGIDRGAATRDLSVIGAPGVVYDAFVAVMSAGWMISASQDLVSGGTGFAYTGRFSGPSLLLDIPASGLPSYGKPPEGYGFSAWVIDIRVREAINGYADIVPDNSVVTPVAAVPEPNTYALFAPGLVVVATWLRRRKPG